MDNLVNKSSDDSEPKLGNMAIEGEVLRRWSANPWKTKKTKLIQFLILNALLTVFLVWAAPELGLFILAFPLLVVGGSANHLTVSEYVITERGIYQKNLATETFKPWDKVRSMYFDNGMGELFFLGKGIRARINRSMPVYYDNRDEIEPLIRELVNRNAGSAPEA